MPDGVGEDITLGEVYRGLQALRHDTIEQFAALNRVMGERLVGREYYQVAHQALQKEVSELEARVVADKREWQERLDNSEKGRRTIWLTLLASISAGAASYISILLTQHPPH